MPDFAVLGKELATFKKSKSQWSTVGASTIPVAGPSGTTHNDGVTEDPAINVKTEPEVDDSVAAPIQMTKRKGGLRTAAQLQAQEAERRAAERRAAERSPTPPDDKDGIEEEDGGEGATGSRRARPDPTKTVHRDASGRILDVDKLKEEERKRVEEEKRKALEREEWSKGVTQRKEREARAREEIDMRGRDVAR